MFSEVQRDYIEHLVKTNLKDYPYYIAFTNTNVTGNNINDNYNFYIILSKEKITANSKYSYTLSSLDNYKFFAVRSGNASYNYHNERVVEQTLSSVNLSINNYEFVYTNAQFQTFSLQPDLIKDTYLTENTYNGFSVVLLIVLLSAIFFKLIGGK